MYHPVNFVLVAFVALTLSSAASARPSTADSAVSNCSTECQPGCEWRMFDHYSTLERAESKLTELTSAGRDARLSMIDGLSIIVRR